jgi:hypothetical protein
MADLLELNPALDLRSLAERFAVAERLQIADFLTKASAQVLRDDLLACDRWRRVINGGGKVYEIGAAEFEALPLVERERINAAVEAEAAYGFQFRYEVARVRDSVADRQASMSRLVEFARLMSSDAVLAVLQAISGASPLVFADAQATRYRQGDFLTRHDDNVAGKHRKLAYVLSLSDWQAEWGGLLVFSDDRGDVAGTIVPHFGALSLFAVPQQHSVGFVAPFAPAPRLSITGWIRSEIPAR